MTDPPHSDRPWSQESKELRLYCRSVCTDVFGPGPTVDRNAPAARARVSPSTRVGTSGRQAPKNPADTSEGPVEPFFPVGRGPPAPQVLQMVLSAPGVRALRCHRPHRLLPLASCLLPLASASVHAYCQCDCPCQSQRQWQSQSQCQESTRLVPVEHPLEHGAGLPGDP